MTLYAETSALLSWLFDEPRGYDVRRALGGASGVVTSELAAFEAERALIRTIVRSIPDLQVLSLDDRIRENARLLGFTVLPS